MPDHLPSREDPVLFPRFTSEQLGRIENFAVGRFLMPGEVLFEPGERNAPLFLLERGTVDIIDRRTDRDVIISRVPCGQFVGDISTFTGQPTVVACVASEPTRALVVDHNALCALVAQHTDIGDILLTTFLARRAWLEGHGYGQIALIGERSSQEAFRLRQFLARNQVPFRWFDVDSDESCRLLLDRWNIRREETPVLVRGNGKVCRRPDLGAVADELGLRVDPGDEPYDLLIAGAGPAGLAAAVYGASEGLRTLVLDADSPGGQAGTSSRIENYLGFFTGISGADLTRQAVLQARKFQAVLTNPRSAVRLEDRGELKAVKLDDGSVVKARCVLIATGARYRRLDCTRCDEFEGRGIYYAATHVESVNCMGENVAVVGGGNSAGQAAVFLSRHARRVYLIVRRNGLEETMSRYLIERIEKTPNIELLTSCQVTALHGDEFLRAIEVERGSIGPSRLDMTGLFVLIGALPRTDWLGNTVRLDENGFVLTGDDLHRQSVSAGGLGPYLLETSMPGVFAAGDVRHGSVKRVAAAVGEGSMAVSFVHRRLAQQDHDRESMVTRT